MFFFPELCVQAYRKSRQLHFQAHYGTEGGSTVSRQFELLHRLQVQLFSNFFINMSSEVLKVFLILIFIWVAYNQKNCQS